MLEILLALGIFVLLVVIALSAELPHGPVMMMLGAATAGIGLAVGVVVGIGYHVALYRALAPGGLLGPRWWWRPTSYNHSLPAASRRTVMSWFYAGVISMVVALAGCALVLVGVWSLERGIM